jgi:5-methylcytosine-specific restriction endonuclease McrBC regulatory subunit McrC
MEVEDRGIADFLADLFIASVDTAALMGYPLGYQTQRRLSPFMSGRIDPRRIARLAIPDGQLPVEMKRLTRDTDLGRLLKWAGRELSRLVESGERRGRLRAWIANLPEVADTPRTLLRSASVSHQFPHLKVAIDIAHMLLADHWGEYGNGALNLPGFLWRSETLFEKAMLRLARQSAHPLGMTADKRRHRLAIESGGTGRLSTTPDIDVHRGGESVVLLDAKYKILGEMPSTDDVYQVVSAGRVCSVRRVGLLYPSEGLGLHVRTFDVMGAGMPSILALVSVGFQSFESLATVRVLKTQLTSWFRESGRARATA